MSVWFSNHIGNFFFKILNGNRDNGRCKKNLPVKWLNLLLVSCLEKIPQQSDFCYRLRAVLFAESD